MNFYLNELSLREQASSERIAKLWVREFAGVCNILKERYELERIFVLDTFYSAELYKEFPMGKLLNDKDVERRLRNIFQYFHSVEFPNDFTQQNYLIDEQNAVGLGLASYTSLFGLSFISEDKWKEANIIFDNKFIAKNISLESHINQHKDLLEQKLSKQLRIPEYYDFEANPLPFADQSNELFNVAEELECIKKISTDRKAKYIDLGTKIAKFNQWEYNRTVSSINSNCGQIRRVFKIGEGTKTYYLSIDLENGAFELFKRAKGSKVANHLGEFSSVKGNKNPSNKVHEPLKLKR